MLAPRFPLAFLLSVVCFLLSLAGATAATRYVWQESPSPAPPYTSWATAAHIIQYAVDAAGPGDTVLVTNGVYAVGSKPVYDTMPNRVAVTKPLSLLSVNGPEVTIIQGYQAPSTTNGNGAIRCVYLIDGASLSGFTLANGATHGVGLVESEGSGGGLFCESTNASVSNCILSGNSASYNGGGAHYGTLNNCTLSGNSAYWGGGAYGGTLNHCTLTGNSALFAGNSYGGGAYYSTLNYCSLASNSASAGGGVADCTLNHCILTGNSASSGGGAYGDSKFQCILNNCTLSGNSATSGGGAYSVTLNNCTLNRNSASYLGGGAGSSTLNNCTLSGNSALVDAGGVYSGTLNNCIVYYNSASSNPNYYNSTYNYSCTTPLPAGPGNIASEPLLADSSHLSAQSPCIGSGSSAYSSGVDIDGESWLNPPCMGADQFVAGQATGGLAVAISTTYTNVRVGFVVAFVAETSGHLAANAWDFGDGVVVSNRPYVSHAWAVPGLYEVRLTGYNDSWPGGVSATVPMQVGAPEVYYVNASNAVPVYPYTNWVSAATKIQEAIDAGTQIGRLVLVADGVYGTGGRAVYGQMTNRVVVSEGVEVRSVNGPLATRIDGRAVAGTTNGNGAIRCAYVGSNAMLSGFTLTNGHTRMAGDNVQEQRGGGALCEFSGVVTNCTLSGNSAYLVGGGAYFGTLSDCTLRGNSAYWGGGAFFGTLDHCALSGNSALQMGGGTYYGTLNNCILIGNLARTGGGAEVGVLNNCTLSGNSARYGGGAYSGTLNNCIVYYNSATNGANYYSSSSITFNYSCTTPMPTNGVGNIDLDPLFVDTNGWSNLRLQSNSPCINAGNNAYVTWSTDLDGNPRIIGGTVDMGAFEFVLPPTPAELVEQLITAVNESDLEQQQPLLATSEAALASIQRGNCPSAVGQLHAFQNKVSAQVQPADPALATDLIAGAGQAIKALGCDGSKPVAPRIRSLKQVANGRSQLQIEGMAGEVYLIEASTNLVNWETVGTAILSTDGSFEFKDPVAPKHSSRFYRIKLSP